MSVYIFTSLISSDILWGGRAWSFARSSTERVPDHEGGNNLLGGNGSAEYKDVMPAVLALE